MSRLTDDRRDDISAGRGYAPEVHLRGVAGRHRSTEAGCQRMAAVNDQLRLVRCIAAVGSVGCPGHHHVVQQSGFPGHHRHRHIAELDVDIARSDRIRDDHQRLAAGIGRHRLALTAHNHRVALPGKTIHQDLIAGRQRIGGTNEQHGLYAADRLCRRRGGWHRCARRRHRRIGRRHCCVGGRRWHRCIGWRHCCVGSRWWHWRVGRRHCCVGGRRWHWRVGRRHCCVGGRGWHRCIGGSRRHCRWCRRRCQRIDVHQFDAVARAEIAGILLVNRVVPVFVDAHALLARLIVFRIVTCARRWVIGQRHLVQIVLHTLIDQRLIRPLLAQEVETHRVDGHLVHGKEEAGRPVAVERSHRPGVRRGVPVLAAKDAIYHIEKSLAAQVSVAVEIHQRPVVAHGRHLGFTGRGRAGQQVVQLQPVAAHAAQLRHRRSQHRAEVILGGQSNAVAIVGLQDRQIDHIVSLGKIVRHIVLRLAVGLRSAPVHRN